jgi:hypothetical protein
LTPPIKLPALENTLTNLNKLSLPFQILEQFEPITLSEMDGVKLMNRTDRKFIFNTDQFENIMDEIKTSYRILEVEGKRQSRYETLYYDTPEFRLYYQHHNGKLNRYKIRHRTYIESGTGFLEVKFKNNKGRTIKTRILKNETPLCLEGDCEIFLNKMLPFQAEILKPAIWINYNRHTFVNKKSAERLTIDSDLEFINKKITKKLSCLVIAEVKQEKKSESPFVKIMKNYHIRKGSISKYCMGIALTDLDVKQNNFKVRLRTIKNKIHAANITSC